MQLHINGQSIPIDPFWHNDNLLSVLREALGLTGAKFGCGVGLCGACTVLIDGVAQRSCLLQPADLGDRKITTIEGLARGDTLHPVQRAWLDESVPQCGYCQTGQIMTTVALLRDQPRPDDPAIDAALAGHLCRCGTQQRVRQAVHRAAKAVGGA